MLLRSFEKNQTLRGEVNLPPKTPHGPSRSPPPWPSRVGLARPRRRRQLTDGQALPWPAGHPCQGTLSIAERALIPRGAPRPTEGRSPSPRVCLTCCSTLPCQQTCRGGRSSIAGWLPLAGEAAYAAGVGPLHLGARLARWVLPDFRSRRSDALRRRGLTSQARSFLDLPNRAPLPGREATPHTTGPFRYGR